MHPLILSLHRLTSLRAVPSGHRKGLDKPGASSIISLVVVTVSPDVLFFRFSPKILHIGSMGMNMGMNMGMRLRGYNKLPFKPMTDSEMPQTTTLSQTLDQIPFQYDQPFKLSPQA